MIQAQTILKVSDNSGAKTAKCIKVLGGFKKKSAKLGETIIVSIQRLRKNRVKKIFKVKKGDVYKALIIRTKVTTKTKKDGLKTFFNENSIALMDRQKNPIGTRIIGPLLKSLKKKKFLSISSGLV